MTDQIGAYLNVGVWSVGSLASGEALLRGGSTAYCLSRIERTSAITGWSVKPNPTATRR
jgi:hypothetical protein